jgi:uncharacterized protein YhaN
MDDTHASTTDEPQTSVDTSRADRGRSLDALHALELHAGRAAPGREREWLREIRDAVNTLERALGIQEQNSVPDEGVLSAIERDEPRLRRRVQELRQRYREIQDDLAALHRQLAIVDTTDMIDVADIRQMLERLANELRYQRARETDIVYEAYAVDIGEGD